MRFFWPCAASLALKVRVLMSGQSGRRSRSSRRRLVRKRVRWDGAVGTAVGGETVVVEVTPGAAPRAAL